MAYTKYSLTPANNNAAPPDGAPEGMLPSAVNDTMRDMMAQIRDVGDGIRGGTYTMTAPVITGGSITGVALSGNTLTNPVITGGSINNTPIGATTANTGAFSTLSATGVTTVQAGSVSAPAITTSGDTNTGIFFPAADTIAFSEGGTESMRITSAGDVGIGTTSPAQRLDVVTSGGNAYIRVARNAQSAGQVGLHINGGTSGTDWYLANLQSSNDFVFFGNGSERMRITSTGDVGVGTTSPKSIGNYKFVTTNATTGSGYSTQVNGTEAGNFYANTGGTVVQENRNLGLSFETNSTERMRITSSGDFCVGGTTSVVASKQTIHFFTGSNGLAISTTDNIASTDFATFRANSATCGVISRVGTTSAVVYTATSDYRLKTVIGSVTDAGQRIDALEPIEYDWNTGGRTKGFLAHKFAEVYPNSVTGEKDAVDKEGKPVYQAMQASSAEVMADLIAEIQSLRKRVAQLESK